MVSFDEGYQGDQAISLEGLELDLSSDFESVHDEIISTPPSMAEDRKMDFDGECSVTVLAVSEEEEEHEDSDVGDEDESEDDINVHTLTSTGSGSSHSPPNLIEPIPLPRFLPIKPEVISPVPRTSPPRKTRMRVQPSLSPESDGESDESSYVPPVRTKKPVTRRNAKTSSTRTRKKSSPVRGGEPRRQQNMVAQKKYRDKKVHGAHLMSGCIVELRKLVLAPLKAKSFQDRVKDLLEQFSGDLRGEWGPVPDKDFQADSKDLDENLWAKQDLAVRGSGAGCRGPKGCESKGQRCRERGVLVYRVSLSRI